MPNIISIAETKSGHEEMDVVYDNNVSSASTTPLPDGLMKAVSRREDSVSNLCRIQQDKNSNSTSLQSEIAVESSPSAQSRLGNVDGSIRAAAHGLFLIVGLIILYPLSFLVSLVTIMFVIFKIFWAVIFKQPILPEVDDDTDDCVPPESEGSIFWLDLLWPIFIAFWLIASPIWIPIIIIYNV